MQPSIIGLALCFVVIVGGGLAACTQAEAGIQHKGITVGEPIEYKDYDIVQVNQGFQRCVMVVKTRNATLGESTPVAISCTE